MKGESEKLCRVIGMLGKRVRGERKRRIRVSKWWEGNIYGVQVGGEGVLEGMQIVGKEIKLKEKWKLDEQMGGDR